MPFSKECRSTYVTYLSHSTLFIYNGGESHLPKQRLRPREAEWLDQRVSVELEGAFMHWKWDWSLKGKQYDFQILSNLSFIEGVSRYSLDF